MITNSYKVIGVMSGTSLDGLDIAFCTFTFKQNKWQYNIVKAETISYTKAWKLRLSTVETKSAFELASLNVEFGHFIGKEVAKFIQKNAIGADFVSSHGHTIFHQPNKKLSLQIGSGAAIAAECCLPVVCDFRTSDVALNGQGAPLVPIGDLLLFNSYKYCLNLGGFANISIKNKKYIVAFDICPVNMALNYLAQKLGKEYDLNGTISKKGKTNAPLLDKLNNISFYKISKNKPKSLGKEWFTKHFVPIIENTKISTEDKLRTVTEHIAIQISNVLPKNEKKDILVTGGGTFNSFLINSIANYIGSKINIPDTNTINFKEALIFAFLGVLRFRNEVNCLKSVTGAKKDSIGGCIYWYS